MKASPDFIKTVQVIFAAAAAKDDYRQLLTSEAQSSATVYEFKLMAAADTDVPRLPETGWFDSSHLLQLGVEKVVDELRVKVSAQGFAGIEQVAERRAILQSADNSIDVKFVFNARGEGSLNLKDTPTIRQALGSVTISVLNDD